MEEASNTCQTTFHHPLRSCWGAHLPHRDVAIEKSMLHSYIWFCFRHSRVQFPEQQMFPGDFMHRRSFAGSDTTMITTRIIAGMETWLDNCDKLLHSLSVDNFFLILIFDLKNFLKRTTLFLYFNEFFVYMNTYTQISDTAKFDTTLDIQRKRVLKVPFH